MNILVLTGDYAIPTTMANAMQASRLLVINNRDYLVWFSNY